MRDKHGWNSWDQYLAIHTRRIRDFDHFIIDDQLTATPTKSTVTWDGVLYCEDGIEIHVRKHQAVQQMSGRPSVRTLDYSYHVLRRVGSRVVNVLRYDDIHLQPGHQSRHHRHRYDAQGNEIEPPEHIGEDEWPTLGDVIEEVHSWWVEQGARPSPGGR